MSKKQYWGLGRRKSAIARVILEKGKGEFKINGCDSPKYLMSKVLLQKVEAPLVLVDAKDKFNIRANAKGGGISGQALAIRLGIARALLVVSSDYRTILKNAKFLVRDSRVKERKKPGLRKARRAKQFSKR